MRFVLSVAPGAFEELREAVSYYELKQTGLGERFFTEWEIALELISKHPFSFQKTRLDYRQISLQSFPYMLIYEVEGNTVNIFRVIFSKKNPEKRYKKG